MILGKVAKTWGPKNYGSLDIYEICGIGLKQQVPDDTSTSKKFRTIFLCPWVSCLIRLTKIVDEMPIMSLKIAKYGG